MHSWLAAVAESASRLTICASYLSRGKAIFSMLPEPRHLVVLMMDCRSTFYAVSTHGIWCAKAVRPVIRSLHSARSAEPHLRCYPPVLVTLFG